MDNSSIPLSTLKPPTIPATSDSPQTLPKATPKLKYKPIFRPRKTAATTEPAKVSETKTMLATKSSIDCGIPPSLSSLDTNYNKGTGYDCPSTKRERLTSAPRLRITGELQDSVPDITLRSSDRKQCVKSDSGRMPEQAVIPTQTEQVVEMPCSTKTAEDITPQGFGDEVHDTKEKLSRIAEVSPERKKIEVAAAVIGVKPIYEDSVTPITLPKAQRTIDPKPHDAAKIFLPQFLAAWGVLKRAIDEALITLHANPAAGPATPLMVLNSLGSTVIGTAIINANIQPKEIKAAIENMLLQYHHRRAKEADGVARMLDFLKGGTTEEEADASMGDTTDDDSKVDSEGMDEDLKIISEAMEECAGDEETSETDQSLSAMEITPTNGVSTLGSSETNGALVQDLRAQGSLETSDLSMDENAELIVTTEDIDFGSREIWTISQSTINGQFTNPANVDIPMSMEVSAEGSLFNSNITVSLSECEILGASMDLDVVAVYGVEYSNLHTDKSGDARNICSTSDDVDSNRDQATAKEFDSTDDTPFAKETAQCQSESSVKNIDSLCDTEEVNEPHNFDITEDCSGTPILGSIGQNEAITILCAIEESANPENSLEIKGFSCGKLIDSVEELNRIASTPKAEEVSNDREIGDVDEFDNINDMSEPGKLDCINNFDGSEQVDVVKGSDAMEPNSLECQEEAEAGFVASTETKTVAGNGSSHLGSVINSNYINGLDDGIRTEIITPLANINEANIFKCLQSTESIGSDGNLGGVVAASSTSSLCVIEKVESIKSLSSNSDPDVTTAGDPDATDKTSDKNLHGTNEVGGFCSAVEANECVDFEVEDTYERLDAAGLGQSNLLAYSRGLLPRSNQQSHNHSERGQSQRQDTSQSQPKTNQMQQQTVHAKSDQEEDEGWANETPQCPTESRVWNWLAGLPEQSEVEEEAKMMEEMRKREEVKNYEKLTLMLESVEARQKSWEGVFHPRSNLRIVPAVKEIPKLAAQVTAAPELVVIPTVILEHRVWPTALLSVWISLMFFVGSWNAFLDLFQLFSPNTRLPDASLSSILLRLSSFGFDLLRRISNSLNKTDLQVPVFLLVLVLWVFSRWDSRTAFRVRVARFIGGIARLAWGIFSLAIMILTIAYNTTMDCIRYLALARDELTTPDQKIPYDIGLGHGGREIIVPEGWNSSPGVEFEIGMDTYLWVGRTTEEEAGVGESLVASAQADIAMGTPSLLVEQVCQRYTLGIGAGKAVADGSGIFYSSLGLCLVSFVVWGRGNRRQLRWRSGRG